MSDIFCDQLMGLGFKFVFKFECKNDGFCCDGCLQGKGGNSNGKLQGVGKGEYKFGECCGYGYGGLGKFGQLCGLGQQGLCKLCSVEEMDLVKVYVICVQKEKEECIEIECLKQEEVCVCCEVKVKLEELLKDKSLNLEVVDIVCYFLYGGKIKCIYVIVEQLIVFNVGEFGVVQFNGCYLLVIVEVLVQFEVVFVVLVVLKVDLNVLVEEDLYVDLQYQVLDDLVWQIDFMDDYDVGYCLVFFIWDGWNSGVCVLVVGLV